MNYDQNQNGLNNNGYNNNYNDNNNYNNNYNNAAYNNAYNNGYNNGYNNYGYNPNMMNNNMGNMNNNNKEPLSYHIKRFLIGFLLLVLLIFILLWLFPTKQGLKDTLTESLNPLYERIFQENIDTMKEVAISYYTTDRLPQKEGETKKLTLGEMLEMKLLLSIKDKNGNMCDSTKSYVEVTKMDKEYKMKVNLSCGDEEDYILVYLGCYNYCQTDVCEKKEVVQAKQKAQQTCTTCTNNIFKKVTNNIKKIIHVTPQKPKPTKYYCAVVNGKYYNNNGKVVSKKAYQKACGKTPPKYYCAVVNGKYYDNKGNIVSKNAYQKACDKTPPKYYCAVVNGKYYDDKGNIVSKSKYQEACGPKPPKYYCAVVNGKYYDDKGNSVSKSEYEAACNPAPKKYKYLYKKTVHIHQDKEYSNWTDWSDDIEYNPNNNDINWGKHEFSWYEKNGSKTETTTHTITKKVVDKTKPIYQDKKVLMGTYSRYACSGYNYFIDRTTNTTYQVTSGWTSVGRVTTSSIPASTNNVKYEFADFDFTNCGDICNSSHKYVWNKYVRNTSTTSKVSTSESSLRAVCKSVVKKDIPVYATVSEFVAYDKKLVTETKKETKTIYYYHYKTRKLVKEEKDETKTYTAWSFSKHDEALIKQGYEYTGIYEEVEIS